MDSWTWVYLTLMASAAQAVRTGGQKHLTAHLSPIAVTFVRFLYGLPFAILYFLVIQYVYDKPFPSLSPTFLGFTLAMGITQITATALLIHLFSLRNFATGTTYARTEAFLTAVVSALFFNEVIQLQGWVAIGVSVAGVVLITIARTDGALVTRLWNKSAAIGLGSGLGFAFSSLLLRRASLSVGDSNFLFTAALTLMTAVIIQTTILGVYLLVVERDQFRILVREWRVGAFVGLTSIIGSIGWFTAMTIQNPSYVKALGQIEFLLTLAISVFFFKERSSPKELVGMALVAAGIAYLLAVAR
ncbi:MAG: DMT family transporter [Rhodospirillaceae bacterium]|jgi:drug/metabolite transporter (DMT)-like permease|nr:DMT family transporter [Rhodospirillaceae bacterium]